MGKNKEDWGDTGATFGNTQIYACGDKRKLVGPPGTEDFHYTVVHEDFHAVADE